MKKFELVNSPVYGDVREKGNGWAVLVVRNDVPAAVIYLPVSKNATFNEVVAEVDFSAISWEEGAREITQAYLGTVRWGSFESYMELGAEDYRKVIFDDGEIVVEKIDGKTFVVGYKDERKRYAFTVYDIDSPEWGNVKWSINFQRGAEIFTRHKEHSRGHVECVEILNDDGERTCWLEGDGFRFVDSDDKVSTWLAAEVSVLDAEGDTVGSYVIGYMRDYDERR